MDKTSKKYFADYGYKSPDESITGTERAEYKFIEKWIDKNSKVLDLGCGDGSLGERLIKNLNCDVYGIEISENGVKQSIAKRVKAEIGDIDLGLKFDDSFFDFVIINVTLQMVYQPEYVLKEALRTGKKVIVSFPNFGYFKSRLQLLLRGKFPAKPLHGCKWYNTRHIHLFSYKDFIELLDLTGAKIIKKEFFKGDSLNTGFLAGIWPNMFSMECILMVERREM